MSRTFYVLLFSIWSSTLAAQHPDPVVELSGGALAFTEATESFAGGGARFYVSPRLSVGPEVTYIFGGSPAHSHLMLTGNLVFDFLRSEQGRLRRVTPFVLAGAGIFHTRERFRTASFNSTEGAFSAGGGLRTALGNRVTLGADLRVGWELHIRVGGTIGVRLGK